MPATANHTAQKLAAGELALGLGLRNLRTMDAAKIARTAGYDWLFIDMEHGTYDLDLACQLSVAALDSGVTPLVRVPGHQHFHASRVLDGGAMGVVFPHVDDAQTGRELVSHCKFPPLGKRSISGMHAQLDLETHGPADIASTLNQTTLVVLMIETPTAVENADEIAAIEGADVLLIGTNDLCAEMGIHGQFGHEKVVEAYRKVTAACQAHGKITGMGGVYDEVLAKQYIEMGARMVLGGNDVSFLIQGAKARSNFLRSLAQS